MLKGILLDIDETVFSHEKAQNYAFSKFFPYGAELLGISEKDFIDAFNYGAAKNKATIHNCAATHHRGLYLQHALEKLNINPFHYVENLHDYFWKHFMDGVEVYPGVIDVLKEVKANGIKVGLCTDMTIMTQYQKISRLGIGDYVDFIVSSEEVNCEKPAPLIFQTALDKMGFDAKDVLMAGDNLKRDILGAEGMGMHAAWFLLDRFNPNDYTGNKYNNYTDGKFLSFIGL